ncbi:MAG: VOC family protein [Planctomycetota bacterium]
MAQHHVPTGFSALTPYLQLEGAAGFISFAQAAFGATIRMKHADGDTLIHGEVVIEGCVLELSEARPEWPATRSALHLYVPDCDAAHARAVAAGAAEVHAPMDQPYGERSSAVRDRWGNDWFIATVTDMNARTGGS